MHRATRTVVLLAALTLQAATWNSHAHPWLALAGLGLVLGVVDSFGLATRRWPRRMATSPALVVLLISLWCWPYVLEMATRALIGWGQPLEMQIVDSLRNLAIVLAAQHNLAARRVAFLASFFLVLFAFLLRLGVLTGVLAGLYALASVGWLIASHWGRLQGAMPAHTRPQLPKLPAVSAVAIVALAVAASALAASRTTAARQLWGFFPSSGGTRQADPYAWSGIGDGDQVVGAEQEADSFGAVETEVFLSSHVPTLYDLLEDSYGKPKTKPKANDQRTIALAQRSRNGPEKRTVASATAGREFSVVRSGPRRQRAMAERRERAVLYAAGYESGHLRLETFDSFDGSRWFHSGAAPVVSPLRIENSGQRPWIHAGGAISQSLVRGTVERKLKIMHLTTARIPSPPQLAAVAIDKVDRLDMFGWSRDGALELRDHATIPPQTIVNTRSYGMNLASLRAAGDFTQRLPRAERPGDEDAVGFDSAQATHEERIACALAPCYALPPNAESLRGIADAWVAGTPRGWQQVEAVGARLRGGFQHDCQAVPAADCPDVTAHFLATGRGPDYLFATTAAVLLRSLGYPTRLASGFYVQPQRYDRVAAQTTVLPEDVHVWAEVCIDGDCWIAIEPTPGYEAPRETHTWQEAAQHAAATLGRWMLRHILALVAVGALVLALALFRRGAAQHLVLAWWWLWARGNVRQRVLWTTWLLDQRARLAGRPRPAHVPLLLWHAEAAREVSPQFQERTRELLQFANRLLYDDSTRVTAWFDEHTSRLCREVAWGPRRT